MTGSNLNTLTQARMQLLYTLGRRVGRITNIVWSSDRRTIASAIDRSNIRVWDTETGHIRQSLDVALYTVKSIALSPDGQTLAAGTNDKAIHLWDIGAGKLRSSLRIGGKNENEVDWISSAAWSPDGRLLAVTSYYLRAIHIWNLEASEVRHSFQTDTAVPGIVWSNTGNLIASKYNPVTVWDAESGQRLYTLNGATGDISSLAWSPDGEILAVGKGKTIEVWNLKATQLLRILEGPSEAIMNLVWSSDSRMFAAAADDGIFLWRCDTWETVDVIKEPISDYHALSIFFEPSLLPQTTLGHEEVVIRTWEINIDALLNLEPAVPSIFYTNAKIVIVGESNVGKSCLALRITQNQYEEQGTTHGMHIWSMSPEKLSPDVGTPAGEKREVVFWDMGGQDEYRLVHQLFFHDTTVALVLFDPTRGRTAFEEVEGWNRRLEKQLQNRKAVKLLIRTKLDVEKDVDEHSGVIDQRRLNKLISDCGFVGYYATSAKTGRGITELKRAISEAIDWDGLAKISRPTLFQIIREEIESRQKKGEVILLSSELEECILRDNSIELDRTAINTVIEQLALQGIITDTRLASGERVLVLQIAQVERYAGSLIIAARYNPYGIPAIDERMVASAKLSFPGITKSERLPLFQERIVLECVVQLFLEHGICMKHEGMLIFPSLFQAVENKVDERISHSIALYYDFSGAIENIYSSLVVKLAVSQQFGRVRLWEDRAEFGFKNQGICGIRKVGHHTGLAHLALFFSDQIQDDIRDLFTIFIEEHLRKEGVNVTEVLEITCGVCGHHFEEPLLRRRLAEGHADVICPVCERRSRISEGAKSVRAGNIDIEKSLLALKTTILRKSNEAVARIQNVFRDAESTINEINPIRILHLSDLHLKSKESAEALFQPLIKDLSDKREGLGLTKLDYMVISGDLTNCASHEEFDSAYKFISHLIEHFKLTAGRCIIVPGNHDLSWDHIVYDWRQKRLIDPKLLQEGKHFGQGDGLLIRNEREYPKRFQNFINFYHALFQQEYPLSLEDQCMPVLFERSQIQFLPLNSAWEIDEFFPSRSGISNIALSKGLLKADEQIGVAKSEGGLASDSRVLRIAVWHHPVTGNEKIASDTFLSHLQRADVRLCLHGHVHEERTDMLFHHNPLRRVYTVGAGSFGALAQHRPESTPRLYNLLEIDHNCRVRVHTRGMRKLEGAWSGWAVWPTADPTVFKTYYDIELSI